MARKRADKYECGPNQAHTPVRGLIFIRGVDLAIRNFQNTMFCLCPALLFDNRGRGQDGCVRMRFALGAAWHYNIRCHS